MPLRDIVVIGASAGGVETLIQLVHDLPAGLPAAVFIVLHLPQHATSALPQILTRSGTLPAKHPTDHEKIEPGVIYIAPPDVHLLLRPGSIRLIPGPRENGHRPAIDPLFRSAARAYGPRVIGVILSGVLDDGTAGLMAIKMRGGKTIVQDPDDALYSGMPRSAIQHVQVDRILPLIEVPSAIVDLVNQPVEPDDEVPDDDLDLEAEMAELNMDVFQDDEHPGEPSTFACPECGGTLWELREGQILRFRCRVGHAFSAETLLAFQNEAFEEAMWIAFRALEENASLALRMAERAEKTGHNQVAAHFREQAEDAKRHAATIHDVLLKSTQHGDK